MLIKKGADVNAKNQQGWTRLGFAVTNGDKETAELLIEKGADMNAKDDVGMTPLHVAARKGHKEIAKLLIAEGADVNTKDENSLTPLDLAIQNQGSVMYPGRQEEIADLLESLAPREQEIIRLYFGLEGDAWTLEAIARKHNLTRERIRQIKEKALRKLRHPARGRRLQSYAEAV